ncbi:MAG: hypothetical protein AAF724_08210 [Pseudomonadota bacterium]
MSDPNAYLMTIVLQRLENLHPGLIQELVDGVNADKDAIAASAKGTPETEEVFESVFSILTRASQ